MYKYSLNINNDNYAGRKYSNDFKRIMKQFNKYNSGGYKLTLCELVVRTTGSDYYKIIKTN